MFINNVDNAEGQEIGTYINEFVNKSKNEAEVNYTGIFMNSVKNNVFLALCLWFAGLTVVGIFVVYALICFRGFTLGYSISSVIATLGAHDGAIFIFSSMLLQNIIFIPAIFALAISGIRLYKSIMKDRGRENIKIEIVRHTIFSAILTIALIVASFVETYVSTNIFMFAINIL